mmetsp:Transcript_64646/g.154305  ORF Transcript_64646/g.154305 Transcript_64646/m.154305 type:complete len:210 (+) Transcript_64646:298-927(+)
MGPQCLANQAGRPDQAASAQALSSHARATARALVPTADTTVDAARVARDGDPRLVSREFPCLVLAAADGSGSLESRWRVRHGHHRPQPRRARGPGRPRRPWLRLRGVARGAARFHGSAGCQDKARPCFGRKCRHCSQHWHPWLWCRHTGLPRGKWCGFCGCIGCEQWRGESGQGRPDVPLDPGGGGSLRGNRRGCFSRRRRRLEPGSWV